jgi:hypothetical protein
MVNRERGAVEFSMEIMAGSIKPALEIYIYDKQANILVILKFICTMSLLYMLYLDRCLGIDIKIALYVIDSNYV